METHANKPVFSLSEKYTKIHLQQCRLSKITPGPGMIGMRGEFIFLVVKLP